MYGEWVMGVLADSEEKPLRSVQPRTDSALRMIGPRS
jgi:hypothetical protein